MSRSTHSPKVGVNMKIEQKRFLKDVSEIGFGSHKDVIVEHKPVDITQIRNENEKEMSKSSQATNKFI